MVQYIITPWRNKDELLQVRHRLYRSSQGKPPSISSRRHAVAQVSVWVQRGNCPHLVESTAILTSAILNDVPGNSTYCVRAAYSAAFCRFVTGLLDSHQDKRRKLSMYAIAKTLGLPATYVELRHQATHEELPSLSKLRTATQKALKWIWEHYWVSLTSRKVAGKLHGNDCKAYVNRLLKEEDHSRRQEMERSLERWSEEELMRVLMEIEGETEDSTVLLRSLKLTEKFIDGGISDDHNEHASTVTITSIAVLKAEMVEMEKDLATLQDEERDSTDSTVAATDLGSKGWAMWEGPWIAKPIGSLQ